MNDYKPNLEGVQLCFVNVSRLYEDSQKVSAETKFALLELSLEELMKAWMLFFSYLRENLKDDAEGFLSYLGIKTDKEIVVTHILDAGTTELGDVNKFRELMGRLFQPDLVGAFKYHDAKLDYLSDLITYLQIYFSINEQIIDPTSIILKIVGNYLKPEDKLDWTPERVNGILKKFNPKNLDQLKRKREDSIYVNKVNGMLVLPIIAIFDTDTLRELVQFLMGALIVQIDSYNAFKTDGA